LPANANSNTCLNTTEAQRAALAAWGNGAVVPTAGKASFNYFLPSFNLKIAPNNELQFRVSASQSINQSETGLTRSYGNYSVNSLESTDNFYQGNPTAKLNSGGNPNLRPIRSNNFDASVEWYFIPNGVGALTFNVFAKDLTDVVTNSVLYYPVTNNGQDVVVQAIVAGNSDKTAHIKGFEIGYQQTYDFLPAPFDGLGINANYTYISSNGIPQSTLNPSFTDGNIAHGASVDSPTGSVDTSKLSYQGLSKDNITFQIFYEKYGVSARLAYNWRSDFLLVAQDVIDPFQPIMQKASGQLDGSITYQLTAHVKIGIQAQNINNSTTRLTSVVNSEQLEVPHAWYTNDRRVSFIVRGSF
jgi:TonB-dependent receptor